jgi:hypothetical protein
MAPINLPNGNEVSEIVLPNGNTASEVIAPDGSTVFGAIPDSALYQFPFGERSDSTLVEKLENADGTANGLTNVSGNWYDGYAEESDGTDDYGDLGTWGDFATYLDTSATVLLTVQTTDTGVFLGKTQNNISRLELGVSGSGGIVFDIRDNNGDTVAIETDESHNDGSKKRVGMVQRGDSVSDMEIWINGSEEPTSVKTEGTSSLVSDDSWTTSIYSHAQNVDGNDVRDRITATMDKIIPCTSDLTSQEIQDDYNAQPWT